MSGLLLNGVFSGVSFFAAARPDLSFEIIEGLPDFRPTIIQSSFSPDLEYSGKGLWEFSRNYFSSSLFNQQFNFFVPQVRFRFDDDRVTPVFNEPCQLWDSSHGYVFPTYRFWPGIQSVDELQKKGVNPASQSQVLDAEKFPDILPLPDGLADIVIPLAESEVFTESNESYDVNYEKSHDARKRDKVADANPVSVVVALDHESEVEFKISQIVQIARAVFLQQTVTEAPTADAAIASRLEAHKTAVAMDPEINSFLPESVTVSKENLTISGICLADPEFTFLDGTGSLALDAKSRNVTYPDDFRVHLIRAVFSADHFDPLRSTQVFLNIYDPDYSTVENLPHWANKDLQGLPDPAGFDIAGHLFCSDLSDEPIQWLSTLENAVCAGSTIGIVYEIIDGKIFLHSGTMPAQTNARNRSHLEEVLFSCQSSRRLNTVSRNDGKDWSGDNPYNQAHEIYQMYLDEDADVTQNIANIEDRTVSRQDSAIIFFSL